MPIVLVGIVGHLRVQLPDHHRPSRQGRVPPGSGCLRAALVGPRRRLAHRRPAQRQAGAPHHAPRDPRRPRLRPARGVRRPDALVLACWRSRSSLPALPPSRSRPPPTRACSSRRRPAMRGRVMGVYMLVFAGGTPLGAPLVGWLSQEFGARWGLIAGGVVSASRRRGRARAAPAAGGGTTRGCDPQGHRCVGSGDDPGRSDRRRCGPVACSGGDPAERPEPFRCDARDARPGVERRHRR